MRAVPVEIKYGKQTRTLTLVVVAGNGPSLMGHDWLEKIQLDWRKIGAVVMKSQTHTSVEQFCDKNQEIFKDKLGTIRAHKG